MPPSPPDVPPPESNTGPANSDAKTDSTSNTMGTVAIVGGVFSFIFLLIWHYGAASLSYAKYGSLGWAILDFFFATFYYPYYALFLNTPTATMMGGRRRKY